MNFYLSAPPPDSLLRVRANRLRVLCQRADRQMMRLEDRLGFANTVLGVGFILALITFVVPMSFFGKASALAFYAHHVYAFACFKIFINLGYLSWTMHRRHRFYQHLATELPPLKLAVVQRKLERQFRILALFIGLCMVLGFGQPLWHDAYSLANGAR